MADILETLQNLKRPGLLLRAARHGVAGYRREVHLRRLLIDAPQHPSACLAQLLRLEARQDDARRCAGADYRVAEHVQTLIAIMAEARHLRLTQRPAAPDALAQTKRAHALQHTPA